MQKAFRSLILGAEFSDIYRGQRRRLADGLVRKSDALSPMPHHRQRLPYLFFAYRRTVSMNTRDISLLAADSVALLPGAAHPPCQMWIPSSLRGSCPSIWPSTRKYSAHLLSKKSEIINNRALFVAEVKKNKSDRKY